MDLRLGALHIRKTRNFSKHDLPKIKALEIRAIDRALTAPISLAKVKPEKIPEGPGLLEVVEENRYLYISRNECLRPAVEQFRTGKTFELVANGFWTPDLEKIRIQIVAGSKVDGFGIGLWERRLIHDREPVFNWPIHGPEDEEERPHDLDRHGPNPAPSLAMLMQFHNKMSRVWPAGRSCPQLFSIVLWCGCLGRLGYPEITKIEHLASSCR